MKRLAALALSLIASGCAAAGGDAGDDGRLSPFREGAPVSGRVLENSTACVVDAVCHLRLDFADTVVVAVYGTGERPAPPCDIPAEVSDIAFQVEPGDVVEVVISRCAEEGYYLRSITPDTG